MQSLAAMLPKEMTELRWRPLMLFMIEVKKPLVIGKTARSGSALRNGVRGP